MRKSESIKELATALVKFQAEVGAAPFNSTNPFLKNRYADLGSIIQTAKPILAKNGLAVSQLVESDDDPRIGLTTVLMHSSGEWIETTVWLAMSDEKGKSNAQVAGSIISYLRRYSLSAILGMHADADDDGNDNRQSQRQERKPAPRAMAPTNGKSEEAPLTLEEAEAVTNRDGFRYGDLDSEKLVHMATGLANVKSPTKEHERKLLACQIILKARSEQTA